MALKKYEEADIASIASAIREKTGGDKTYKVSQMDEGVNEVYEAGKKAEHDAFWNVYQNYGNRAIHLYAYAWEGWTDDTFKPKYDIKPTDTAQAAFSENKITDFRRETIGVEIDTSQATRCSSLFIRSKAKYIGIISFETATEADYAFYQCRDLESIEKIILKEDGTNNLNAAFNYCDKLKEVRFEGFIGKNVRFEDCYLLSKESIKSIMKHLSDTATFTVTLPQLAVNRAFTTEEWQAIINAKPTNVTVSLI